MNCAMGVVPTERETGNDLNEDKSASRPDWVRLLFKKEDGRIMDPQLFVARPKSHGNESSDGISKDYVLVAARDASEHGLFAALSPDACKNVGVLESDVDGEASVLNEKRIPIGDDTDALLLAPTVKEYGQLPYDSVKLGAQLGKGNFGEVYKGVYKNPQTGQVITVAVKRANDTMPEVEKRTFLREARIMQQYDHPNIVKLIGVCAEKEPMMIVLELIPGENLVKYLMKTAGEKTDFDWLEERVRFCLDAAKGMQYLADQKCMHRDLAARNCLLGAGNVVKISDFGMSREGSEYTINTAKPMPIKWTAIEVVKGKTYTTMADVWSFGILMWEIFSNAASPYAGHTNQDTIAFIKNGGRMQPPQGMPPTIGAAMIACWAENPLDRPHFNAIVDGLQAYYDKIKAKKQNQQ